MIGLLAAKLAEFCSLRNAATHLAMALKSERVTLLEVSFPDLVADPGAVVARLAELLPGRFTPGPAVAACVKPALFRNRS